MIQATQHVRYRVFRSRSVRQGEWSRLWLVERLKHGGNPERIVAFRDTWGAAMDEANARAHRDRTIRPL